MACGEPTCLENSCCNRLKSSTLLPSSSLKKLISWYNIINLEIERCSYEPQLHTDDPGDRGDCCIKEGCLCNLLSNRGESSGLTEAG